MLIISSCAAGENAAGECVTQPDPSKNGVTCQPVGDPYACYTFVDRYPLYLLRLRYVCADGACVAVPDETKLGQPCIHPTANATACNRFICGATLGAVPAACISVADTTLTCSDESHCTTDACVEVRPHSPFVNGSMLKNDAGRRRWCLPGH